MAVHWRPTRQERIVFPRSGRVASWGASSGSRVSLARSSLPRGRPCKAAAAHGRWASILTCHSIWMCEIVHDSTNTIIKIAIGTTILRMDSSRFLIFWHDSSARSALFLDWITRSLNSSERNSKAASVVNRASSDVTSVIIGVGTNVGRVLL